MSKTPQEVFKKLKDLDTELDECVASGAGCYYKLEEIPSEFITGVAGSTEYVYQCAYCGKAGGSHG